jgi:hypothetical protein
MCDQRPGVGRRQTDQSSGFSCSLGVQGGGQTSGFGVNACFRSPCASRCESRCVACEFQARQARNLSAGLSRLLAIATPVALPGAAGAARVEAVQGRNPRKSTGSEGRGKSAGLLLHNSSPGAARLGIRSSVQPVGCLWGMLQTSSQSHWPLPTESSVLRRSRRSASRSTRRTMCTDRPSACATSCAVAGRRP